MTESQRKGLKMKLSRVIGLLLLIPALATAGVNLKNGNFYISYSDIIVPGGGHDLEIARTYNSRATEKGWFGFGWGSDFETNLTVSADGSVIVHENGAGAMTRFTPKEAVNAQAAAERIVAEMRKKTSLNDDVATTIVVKLKNDADLRQAYAKRFNVKSNLAVGTTLYSNERGLQQLDRIKEGYKRSYGDGREQFFNEEGQLSKIKHKDGYSIALGYKNGRLESIKDSQAKQLFFSWYPEGRVKEVWSGADNKKVSYKYKGDDLIESADIANNKFVYTYDQNHNMTGIGYKDNSKMEIAYTPKTMFVEKIKDQNGEETKYEYGSDPKNPDFHYWTVVKKKSLAGKEVANRYEYEIKSRPDGSSYTYRILTALNDVETETIYSECCSLPIKIKRGKHVTNFEYNKDGLLLKKSSTKGEYVELKYHETFKKITRVVNNEGWTNFVYDKKGNLYKAENNAGKSILLIYNLKGQITKMIDHVKKDNVKRTLTFEYNALGKPVEIAMTNVGKINVSYDNYGEIKKVDSKAGHKMALQVTQAFQSLLAIVRPAGVNLNL